MRSFCIAFSLSWNLLFSQLKNEEVRGRWLGHTGQKSITALKKYSLSLADDCISNRAEVHNAARRNVGIGEVVQECFTQGDELSSVAGDLEKPYRFGRKTLGCQYNFDSRNDWRLLAICSGDSCRSFCKSCFASGLSK